MDVRNVYRDDCEILLHEQKKIRVMCFSSSHLRGRCVSGSGIKFSIFIFLENFIYNILCFVIKTDTDPMSNL